MFSDQNQPVASCRWHVSQSGLGALLMPQGKCGGRGLWPRPHCVPPHPGRPSLGGDAVQGGWIRKGPQTLLSLQRSPHPSGTPPPWCGSFRRPPTDPRQDSLPGCAPTGIPLASDGCWKQVWGKPSPGGGVKGVQWIKPRGEKHPHTHQLCLRGVSDCPHLQLLELEVLLGRQLRAAVCGACGLGLAVSFPEIDIDPQPKVTVLSSHALRREACHTPKPTPALRPQGHAGSECNF